MARKLTIREQARNSLEKMKDTEIVQFNDIILDGGTQNRVIMDNSIITEYAEAMLQKGSDFPPIVLFKDNKKHYWLADGFHRLEAMKSNGFTKYKCVVHYGSLREAILYSLSANASHGLRRTNEDKRKAVLTLLNDDEWKKYSAEKLSEISGVSARTIGNIKKELGLDTNNIIGKDGREYKIKMTPQNSESKKLRTKYYRFKMGLEYKDEMKEIIKKSKLNESALLKEAFEILRTKYLS